MKPALKKIYHKLAGHKPNTDALVSEALEELSKHRAPTNMGMREDYPALPNRLPITAMAIRTEEHEAIAQLYTGQKIFVDTRDISLAPHLMMGGVWEAHVTRAIATLLKEDDTFFDIGANFAYYSLIAATRLNLHRNHIRIHAFEPNPDLVALIRKSFDINGLNHAARINQVGIGDKPGKLTLHRDLNLWGSASFDAKAAHISGKEVTYDVPVTTIDDYCKEHNITKVDVIKLDVEGYEDHAYAGMKHTIKNNPDIRIAMEFTFGAYKNQDEFFAQLKKDFAYMYYIDQQGEFEYIGSYDTLKSKTEDELVMIVLTNKELV